MLHAIIMAGGGGTRFWPRSRRARPKQFLTLAGEHTLLQLAAERIESQVSPSNTWVFTAAAHRDEAARQLSHLPAEQIVGEPAARDTAPCVALGAALAAKRDPEAVLLVMPADHVIEPAQEFRRTVHAAEQLAREYSDALLTLGIPPTWPSTGYGYIHRGDSQPGRQGAAAFRVRRFREKPDEPTARQFVESGQYFWNAGVFVGRAAAFLTQFGQHEPAMHEQALRIAAAWDTPRQADIFAQEFPRMRRISFDFAVMEKCPEVLVLATTYAWDDVGSWLALERLNPHDANGNTVLAQHVGVKTSGCVVVAEPGKVIATLGVKDLIIVQDGDCILVADKSKEGDVRELVEEMKRRGLEAHL